jgi:hypothetical protein
VGRAALDEDAIRLIEENNPDIEFDWTKILEAQPPVAPAPEETRDRRRRVRGQTAAGRARVAEAGVREPVAEPAAEPGASAAVPDAAPMGDAPQSEVVTPEVADVPEIEPPVLVPVTVYHGGADVLVASVVDQSPRQSAVEARLGSELLGRIRARYAEISARITERVGGDPARFEEMRRAAEALNPDLWVTEDEIAAGLQHFDARLGEIRRALGIKRRRRSRRGGRRRRGRRPDQSPTATAGSAPTTLETGPPDHADELDQGEVGDDETDSDDTDH